jgi:GT2 family glycosyltransferase
VLADKDSAVRVTDVVERQLGLSTADRWEVITDPAEALTGVADPTRLVAFLQAGETLAGWALERCRSEAVDPRVTLVYGDHDATDASGRHVDPWFVPDWSPHRLLSQDYIQGAFLVRDGIRLRSAIERLGPFRGQVGWRYALLLDVTVDAETIVHVPSVLWSRPTHDDAEIAGVRAEAELRSLERALVERGEEGVVVTTDPDARGPVRQVAWRMPRPAPRVSVVVPTTASPDLVAGTLALLTEATAYPDLEVIVLDNSRGRHPDGVARLAGAAVTLLECDESFNWARFSNMGARRSTGELLLFLNDDMEATHPTWLEELVRVGVRPDVGAVGPLLLYPDGTIQHAGVLIVSHGGGAAHLFQGLDPAADLYLDLQRVARESSAVTGACLLVPRADFEAVGGFDEALAVSGNDVDFCLRLVAAGRRVLWTPRSVLVHHEGRSRRNVAYLRDEGRLWERWSHRLSAGDPYSNPNLAQDRVDLDLDWSRIKL